jgi:predicted O-methyltransferase YrrM
MAEFDLSSWYAGKDFTTDWTSQSFPVWAELLASRRDDALRVLEIGSWEGRSAILFLRYLAHCHITCVDTFAGSVEHSLDPDWARAALECERRFDANLAEFGERVEKIKATSSQALARLGIARRRFDLVYIDGSHHSENVYADTVMCWPLLNEDAIIIFDDYEWTLMPTAEERPKLAIDAFLAEHVGEYSELYRGYQLIVRKRRPQRGLASAIKRLFE